ncbi:MAG TPA: hypothetical protein VEF04_12355 [Blastocatellia bacterium]|nr:hypothetical protein [Blastocatellia bacterium]
MAFLQHCLSHFTREVRKQISKLTQQRVISLLICLALLVGLAPRIAPARAGLPLGVTPNGRVIAWRSTITYHIDQGSLGSLSNEQASSLVQELFQYWQNVPTANLSLQMAGPLPMDVTAENYTLFRNVLADSFHPIIFDTDGSITDTVLGVGASNFTAGFAGPMWAVSPDAVADGRILDATAILNGKILDGSQSRLDEFKAIMLHEFGHFLGLGHSQLNLGSAFDRESVFANNNEVPIMFPISLPRTGTVALTTDDKAQISAQYPNAAATTGYGTIRGHILMPDGGTPFQGANVVARRIDDPMHTAVSSVSGYLYKGTGTGASSGINDASYQGLYEITGLPPGNYTVEIEPIHPGFISGSRVGPLDPPVDLPGPPEYFNWDESNNDSPSSAAIITVTANSTTNYVNIILNNTATTSINETETNDTVVTAQTITLPSVISGSASSNDPGTIDQTTGEMLHDFYTFTANADDWVTFDVNWNNPSSQFALYLYDGNGLRIARSMSCVYGSGCVASRQIGPMRLPISGRYYVAVGALNGTSTYTLQATSKRSAWRDSEVAATTVNAASFQPDAIAPGAIASLFGTSLSTMTKTSTGQPLPTLLGNASVLVNGTPAPLFFVSPFQINYLIPSDLPAGQASIVVSNDSGVISRGTVEIANVSPAFFTANSNGQGVPAGYITRSSPNNAQPSDEPLLHYDAGKQEFVPLEVPRPAGDAVYLILFGTGIRRAPNADNSTANGVAESVQATIGGVPAQIFYAGPAPGYTGLDQVNIRIPDDTVSGPTIPIIVRINNGNGGMAQANPLTIALQ